MPLYFPYTGNFYKTILTFKQSGGKGENVNCENVAVLLTEKSLSATIFKKKTCHKSLTTVLGFI